MKNESIIWKIGMFKKDGKEAECLVCHEKLKLSGGQKNHQLGSSNQTVI
jgi:hypothetical protein